jgi:peptidoglycan hydrolase CwlO-like protein
MSDRDGLILAALGRLEAKVDDLGAGQTAIHVAQAKLEAGQAKLEAAQAKLEEGYKGLREDQTALRVGLMARMDRLQDTLTSIRDDIIVNMGRADRAHEAADSTRAELRALGEQVNAMTRQITRLQTQVRELRGDP